ncbi:MAG: hypothetical protein R3Y35_15065 [Clostridia bacterium]
MTNEELLELYKNGDYYAFDILFKQNEKYIHKLVWDTVRKFHLTSDYVREELYGVACLEFCRLVFNKKYNPEKAKFTTYITKYIIKRMELLLIKRLDEREKKISIYSNPEADDTFAYFDSLLFDPSFRNYSYNVENEAFTNICLEMLSENFQALSEKEKDVIGGFYGVYDYEKLTLEEIGINYLLKKDAVLKSIDKIKGKLRDNCYDIILFNDIWEWAKESIKITLDDKIERKPKETEKNKSDNKQNPNN